jgi:aspartate racemase
MKTIGVLGGLGPMATMDFEARIHTVSQQLIPQKGNSGYPPMVVYYHRRPPVVADEAGHPIFPIRPHPLLLDAAARLGSMADFLVITSNGVHLMQPLIEQASGRKVLSMVDATLKEVERRGWRRVGVITFVQPDVYSVPLERMGLECVIVPDEMQKHLDAAISVLNEGKHDAEIRGAALDAVSWLRAQGTDGIILGCTEVPLMLRPLPGRADMKDEADAPDLINPAQLLAEAAVRHAME